MNKLTYADLGLVESEMPRKKLKGFSYYERLRLQVKDLQDGCYVFLDSYACMTDCMTLFIAYASMPVPYGLPHEWREVARWEDRNDKDGDMIREAITGGRLASMVGDVVSEFMDESADWQALD